MIILYVLLGIIGVVILLLFIALINTFIIKNIDSIANKGIIVLL